jgi:hypothetical protein
MESLWARQWKVYGQGNGKSMGKAMESLWARQWKVYGQGNGQAYERNNDEIGEMGNVSSMFHIFGSMFLMCRLLISMVFDVFVLKINVF